MNRRDRQPEGLAEDLLEVHSVKPVDGGSCYRRKLSGVEIELAVDVEFVVDVQPTVDPNDVAIARGMALANADTPLLIAGSVYAAGEARRILMEEYNAPSPSF